MFSANDQDEIMDFSRSLEIFFLISPDTVLFSKFFCFYKKTPTTCWVLNAFHKIFILLYSILNFLNFFWDICILFFCCISVITKYSLPSSTTKKWVLTMSAKLELTCLTQYDLDNKDNVGFFSLTHLGKNLESVRN